AERYSSSDDNVLGKTEHRCWNAYTRCEGFIYEKAPEDVAGELIQKKKKDLLKKTHNCLVPFDMLAEDLRKTDDD
nr:hypothetical protein [Eubacterium sp.]